MNVTPALIDQTLLEILLQSERDGSTAMGLLDLERRWHRTRLRSLDLHAAMGRLEASDDVRLETRAEGRFLALTDQGQDRARELTPAERAVALMQRMLLRQARRWSQAAASVRRRRTDMRVPMLG